jgi:hypothetical protein
MASPVEARRDMSTEATAGPLMGESLAVARGMLAVATLAGVAAEPHSASAEAIFAREPTPGASADEAQERLLLSGSIVRDRDAGGGTTGSRRVTLRLDGAEHDAHVQAIDETRPMANLESGLELDFRDSYVNNVAAYRLDRLLGLGMVPVTVARRYRRGDASFTWWIDGLQMSERERKKRKIEPPDVGRWNSQALLVRVFDELIHNTDRHLGNLLIDGQWRIWMIDHTRAFKIFKTLPHEKNLGTRCPRQLLAALRGLDAAALRIKMGDLLDEGRIDGLLARRDRIVAHFDARIAELGEAAVVYELPP